jgi:hypothetical protein
MARHSGLIRVVSDGVGHSTVVMDGNDTVIDNVGAVTLWIASGELNHADLTIYGTSVDIRAEIGDVTLLCPICEETQTHNCTPKTLGGK